MTLFAKSVSWLRKCENGILTFTTNTDPTLWMSIPGRQLVEIHFERDQQKMRAGGGGKGFSTGFRQNLEVVEICSSIGWVGFGEKNGTSHQTSAHTIKN